MAVRRLNHNLNVSGNVLKELRYQKELSQSDLARELELLGISMHKNDIQRIENNQRTVKDFELWGFSVVLNVDLSSFFKDIKKHL